MKINKWTLGLAAVGLVSLAPAGFAQTNTLLTSLSATTISGYVDTSAVWNPGTGTANPAPFGLNAGKQNGFNLDSVDIKLSKPLEEGKWSAGYVAELSYGTDALGIDGSSYPLRQAYVNFGVPVGNGLEFKLGRWDGLLGYESNDTMNNPNWSFSYGKTFEPTENTGLLASYKFADWVGLQVGAVDTVSTFPLTSFRGYGGDVRSESRRGVTSLLTLTAPDSWGFLKGSALYGGLNYGPGSGSDMTEWYVGATVNTPLTGLTLGASYDCISDMALPNAAAAGAIAPLGGFRDAGYFESIAGYVSFKVTDKATLNGRVEYANGSALSVLEQDANVTPYNTLNKVFALTGTFQYDLWANVISRLEVRWDHNAGSGGPAFGGEVVGVPTKNNEVMIAANVIYKF